MKNRFFVIAFILMLLLTGTAVYLFSRTGSTTISEWIDLTGYTERPQLPLSNWVLFVFPDLAWMMAFVLTILLVWDFRITRQSAVFCSIALIVGLALELSQKFHWLKGTFDTHDLLGLSLGWLLPISFLFIKTNVWRTN